MHAETPVVRHLNWPLLPSGLHRNGNVRQIPVNIFLLKDMQSCALRTSANETMIGCGRRFWLGTQEIRWSHNFIKILDKAKFKIITFLRYGLRSCELDSSVSTHTSPLLVTMVRNKSVTMVLICLLRHLSSYCLIQLVYTVISVPRCFTMQLVCY